ncbi:flagellar hook protein FlgE [Treponema peruense]|uniref:Flagellar hook protein FlgE n=2 Tax=Treponema TaxID=157 RepID=A0A7T3RBL9_9SPIR|nr:flagellar hook protein FlgE [Treponema peruense]QQA00109.1 flagellar hook protein FlgE [Treponema peruense]
MMRSLYAGVSGLQNHQTRMDVIGNNISNVNTYGFKRGRVSFQDMISQQINGAARPTEEVGGVNPKEVGLGMSVASIDTIFTQGNLQTTGVSTDLAIQGNGFFVLKNGDETFYSRAGVFGVDSEGTLVNPANGLRVQGWMAEDANGRQIVRTSATPTDIVIPVGQKDPPKATENVRYFCNLNKNTPEIPENPTADQLLEGTWQTEINIYDTYGNAHQVQMNFSKVPGNPNQWNVSVNVDPDNAEFTQTRIGFGTTDGVANTYTLNFDNTGKLLSVADSAGNTSNPEGEIVLQASYNVADSNADAAGNPYRHTFSLSLGTIGSMENTITQAASKSTTKANFQDGYKLGYLDNFKIDQSGTITGVYSNGSVRTIGQVAMASFTNQGGLEKKGDNTYAESINSGMANIGESGTQGKGSMLAGTLEMSNVDLTEQLTDMIVTQRGFESNAKTIQTGDSMLETVINLKR